MKKAAVIMGSDSDWPVVKAACQQLDPPWDRAMLGWPKMPTQIAECRRSDRSFWNVPHDSLVSMVGCFRREDDPKLIPAVDLQWLQREFREFWHPPRGNLMVGVSRTALPERTISFEYLRLEPKADGIYYVSGSPGKPESAFKLVQGARDGNDEIYTFKRGGADFPSTLVYRRAGGGWLYIEVAGQVKGRDDKVTYPFRRVDCETGEFIRK